MLWFEPYPFVSDSTPEEDQRLRIEVPTGTGKLIKLSRLADGDPSHVVHALESLLSINVLLDDLRTDSTRCTGKIRTCPQRWQFLQDRCELLSQGERGAAFQFFDDFRGTIRGPHPNKEVNMIRLNSQGENLPAFLFAFSFNQLGATILQFAGENRFPSFRTPDEMIDNQMDTMLIPLVGKLAFVCRFHIDNIQYIRQSVKLNGPLAKATDKPAYPPGLKSQRLAAGSFSVNMHSSGDVEMKTH